MEIRKCVECGVKLEVIEATDTETSEIVPVPEHVMCGRCAAKKQVMLRMDDHIKEEFDQLVMDFCEGLRRLEDLCTHYTPTRECGVLGNFASDRKNTITAFRHNLSKVELLDYDRWWKARYEVPAMLMLNDKFFFGEEAEKMIKKLGGNADKDSREDDHDPGCGSNPKEDR